MHNEKSYHAKGFDSHDIIPSLLSSPSRAEMPPPLIYILFLRVDSQPWKIVGVGQTLQSASKSQSSRLPSPSPFPGCLSSSTNIHPRGGLIKILYLQLRALIGEVIQCDRTRNYGFSRVSNGVSWFRGESLKAIPVSQSSIIPKFVHYYVWQLYINHIAQFHVSNMSSLGAASTSSNLPEIQTPPHDWWIINVLD